MKSLVCFFTPNGDLAGNGVLVSDPRFAGHPGGRVVLSCTHVVLQALGRSETDLEQARSEYLPAVFVGVPGKPTVELSIASLGRPTESDLALLVLAPRNDGLAQWPAGASHESLSTLVPRYPLDLRFGVFGADHEVFRLDQLVPGVRIGQGTVFCESRLPFRIGLSLQLPTDPPVEPQPGYCGSPILTDNPQGPGVLGLWHGRFKGERFQTYLTCGAVFAQ